MSKYPFGVILFFSLICAVSSGSALALTIVADNNTPGNYNSSIGDLGENLPWFPAPNTFGGTQDEIFISEPDLSAASVALGDWLNDPGNLNANWTTPIAIPVSWALNTEVAIVYSFDAGPGLNNITADFERIDNGIHIWVDGIWKFGARDPEGRDWTNIALGDVGAGTHYIQILLEDSGGATVFQNPSITGTVVPIPAAAWLFATGLIGLVGITRRKRKH